MDKDLLVKNIFDKVASKYDLMNDCMSFGMHRIWKRNLVKKLGNISNKILLDVASGTGDIALEFLKQGGSEVIISDINESMLQYARLKIIDNDSKFLDRIKFVNDNAENLSAESESVDFCTIGFGVRNMSNLDLVFKEVFRVLKNDSTFIWMEFLAPKTNTLGVIYDFYLSQIIPQIGKYIAKSEDSYLYLSESIKIMKEPDYFIKLMKKTGFSNIKFEEIFMGVCGIYSGIKKI